MDTMKEKNINIPLLKPTDWSIWKNIPSKIPVGHNISVNNGVLMKLKSIDAKSSNRLMKYAPFWA